MKSPFAPYTSGGIEPNQNIASTGRFLGELAYKSFSDAGNSLAEGMKAYQKNAAEDEYLTEALSVQAADLQKWAGMVSQDPRYAPMLEGLMPMMEKASKGPTMSLNQKRALHSSLGAYLKAVPDDLRTIDAMAASQERLAADEAEAGAVLEGIKTLAPTLGMNPNRRGFAEQASGIANEIAAANNPAARRSAVAKGKMFLQNVGNAMQLQDAETASRAMALGGSEEAQRIAGAATFVGQQTADIGGINLADAEGKPLSANEGLALFNKKIEEFKAANPSYDIQPDAQVRFLASMAKGIQDSKAPEDVKAQWMRSVGLKASELASASMEGGNAQFYRDNYGKAGDEKPTVPLSAEQRPELPPNLKALQETVKLNKERYSTLQRPSIVPHWKGSMTTQEEDDKELANVRVKAAEGIVTRLSDEILSANPKATKDEVILYVAGRLQKMGLLNPKGDVMQGVAKGEQAALDELKAEAENWILTNLGAKEALEFKNRGLQVDTDGYGPEIAGGVATAAAGGVYRRYGSAKLPLTKKAAEAKKARVDEIIKKQRERFVAREVEIAEGLGDLQVYVDKDVARAEAEAKANNKPFGDAERAAATKAATERGKKLIENGADLHYAHRSLNGQQLQRSYNLVDKQGNLLKPQQLLEYLNDPKKSNLRKVTGLSDEEIKKAIDKLREFGARRTTRMGRKVLPDVTWGERARITTRTAEGAAKGSAALGAIALLGFAGDLVADEISNSKTDELSVWQRRFGKDGELTRAIAESEARQTATTALEKDVETRVNDFYASQKPAKIDAPVSAAVTRVATADLYRAATHQETIQRTAEFINRGLGFDYSGSRAIAEKLYPPSTTPTRQTIAGKDFLVIPDPKGGKATYQELAKEESPDSIYFGTITPQEVRNPDGSVGFTVGIGAKQYSHLVVNGFKYPSFYTPAMKQETNVYFETTNNLLSNMAELKAILQPPDGSPSKIRLLNRDEAARAQSLAILIGFQMAQIKGTPPISNVELEQLRDAAGVDDINKFFQLDSSLITKIDTSSTALKGEARSKVQTLTGNGKNIVFLDEVQTKGKSPAAAAAYTTRANNAGR